MMIMIQGTVVHDTARARTVLRAGGKDVRQVEGYSEWLRGWASQLERKGVRECRGGSWEQKERLRVAGLRLGEWMEGGRDADQVRTRQRRFSCLSARLQAFTGCRLKATRVVGDTWC